jgi:DNA ligase-1
MIRFAALLQSLAFTPSRGGKLRLLDAYFRAVPDPDRGWALAALTGGVDLPQVTPSFIRGVAEARVDPVLFRLSHDYVGDLAETVALIWPEGPATGPKIAPDPGLAATLDALRATTRADRPAALAALFDTLGASERLALVKLCTGGLRVGVSGGLARQALAAYGGKDPAMIEELWHGLRAPYADLFAWLDGGPAPQVDAALAFRPMMLANPLDEAALPAMAPAAFAAEVKWDGIRIEAASCAHGRRLYSRTGEDIAPAFPDLLAALDAPGCIDGELLVLRGGEIAPFSDLQSRLNRKRPTKGMLADLPAIVMAYDLLHDGESDLRALPWHARRAALEGWIARHSPARVRLSEALPFDDWPALRARRAAARGAEEEGVMIKRRDAPYLAGRPAGQWFKWKRAPLTADCVLMYAQRGHGRRSSYYSDYTFGVWAEGEGGPYLAPVGKAYSGFTDEELARLDKWVRAHLTERFGPVRGVTPELVLEVAFDALAPSGRRKSGVAMRFPRIARIRWDKPAAEADRLSTLRAMAGLDPEG